MKKPAQPPDMKKVFLTDPNFFERLQPLFSLKKDQKYYHWDKLRRLPTPAGFTPEDVWLVTKFGRLGNQRPVPLRDCSDQPFTFSIPDRVQERLHEIDLGAGGKINVPSQVLNPNTRDQYIVNSLMQEAITSSQLEGAVTTREVAKEMLVSGRPPRDASERMIINNYRTMQRIRSIKSEALTPELVLMIHSCVTDGTLEKDGACGRYRKADEDVKVVDEESGEVFHIPPPAEQLPGRVQKMCDFANAKSTDTFIHPVIRAIILHFWLAYDHPFVDGNGRTARALFYWAMLRQGYWLFEYISISDILRQAPVKYARSFLYTESDDNDLTYFINHQAEVIHRAIGALHEYIDKKCAEVEQSQKLLRDWDELNHRQLALLTHAIRHPGFKYRIEGHQRSHNTVYETARQDLLSLTKVGLLQKNKVGKMMIFRAPTDLLNRIQEHRLE